MLAVLEIQDYFFFFAAFLTICLVFSASKNSPSSEIARLRRLERTVDAIIQQLNIDLPEPWIRHGLSREVCDLADQGKKLEAIKTHRAETGAGLKESKDAIEAYLGE